ncbi:MAG TPA: type II toxin-antitoxin system VapC family toxin [Vicinamibacterales bacterium]|nr:type II toxin-antitoxin system VapC family toxin [Vicinamibacterales bacterium]
MLLLDTPVWIWTASGDTRRLGQKTRRLIARAEAQGSVGISVLSIFELTALHTLGRLRLTRLPSEWVRESIERSALRVFDLDPAAAIDAGSIPGTALADPIDRLLVATARRTGARFLSADQRILDYAAGEVRVHDART